MATERRLESATVKPAARGGTQAARIESVPSRSAALARKTRETNIAIRLDLDGTGQSSISTGVPFLDHMLESFARHGFFNLSVEAEGVHTLVPFHMCITGPK